MLLPGCEHVVLRESRELPTCEFCDVKLLLVLQPRTRLSYMQMGLAPWTCRTSLPAGTLSAGVKW